MADLHQTVSIFKEYHPDTANTGVTQPDVSAENGKNLIRNTGNKDCTFRATYMVADTGTYSALQKRRKGRIDDKLEHILPYQGEKSAYFIGQLRSR